ncbi:hypothetical protein THRCLA_02602 [Thraustotheca clavata]|uniref:Coatomer subunit zeta n=1 Tax=Thraustotheca clavata TaxID=74557 RepID=A0A1W0A4N7_9STRA|nr:hypothetical protein THRCLA_02602 [Thraustotheca clavata]
MLHSALVTTEKGVVLMSRYMRPSLSEEKRIYEETLFSLLNWNRLQLANDGEENLVVCLKQYVVYRKHGDMIWFLSGNGEDDELVLHDVLETIVAVAGAHMEKRCTESLFLSNHAKILVALDELVFQGHVDNTEVASILQMTKLKPYPTKV